MAKRQFIDADPAQNLLMSPSLKDWLPEGHLAYFIEEVVKSFDLSDFYASYERGVGRGAPPFAPGLLLRILLYCYSIGVFSSRKIAKRCIEDVACRYLAGQLSPDFRTFIKFRRRHLKRFQYLFVQVVNIAREAGMVKLGHVSIDGSKVKANASKHKAMSYAHLLKTEEKLKREIAELLDRANAVDEAEDAEHGDYDGYSLPEKLRYREGRLKAIEEAKKRLEERAKERARSETKRREDDARARAKRGEAPKQHRKQPDPVPKGKEQENFTDPESRIMRDGATKGFIQGYNCTMAIDAEQHIIVANNVGNCAADAPRLIPMVDRVEATLGIYPKKVSADAGYKSELNFEALDARGIDGYVACNREVYDPSIKAPRGRIPNNATQLDRMKRKLKTKRGRAVYAKRKSLSEPPFGWLKHVLGFRQFLLRGVEKVQGEFDLVCTALNLRRMAAALGS